MPIQFDCPACGDVVRVSRRFAGKKGKCPHCQRAIVVPATGVTQSGSDILPAFVEEPPDANPRHPPLPHRRSGARPSPRGYAHEPPPASARRGDPACERETESGIENPLADLQGIRFRQRWSRNSGPKPCWDVVDAATGRPVAYCERHPEPVSSVSSGCLLNLIVLPIALALGRFVWFSSKSRKQPQWTDFTITDERNQLHLRVVRDERVLENGAFVFDGAHRDPRFRITRRHGWTLDAHDASGKPVASLVTKFVSRDGTIRAPDGTALAHLHYRSNLAAVILLLLAAGVIALCAFGARRVAAGMIVSSIVASLCCRLFGFEAERFAVEICSPERESRLGPELVLLCNAFPLASKLL